MPETDFLQPMLEALPKSEAVEAAYLAVRLFRYRYLIKMAKSAREDVLTHIVTKDRGLDKSDSAAQTALTIVKAIEKKEGKKIEQLKDKIADAYTSALSETLQRIVLKDTQLRAADRKRARSILGSLREMSTQLQLK
jgi:hypothetical protein